MLFKRRKKAQSEETTDESLLIETDNAETEAEPVNIEKVASEVADDMTIFEASDKEEKEKTTISDSPTIRIPNLKELTDDLGLAEAEELLEESQTKDSEEFDKNSVDGSTETTQEDNASSNIVSDEEDTPDEDVKSADEEPVDNEAIDDTEETTAPIDAAAAVRKKKAAKLLRKKKKSSFRRKQELKHRLSLVGNILMWSISICLFVFCLSNLYQQLFNEDKAVGFFEVGNAVVVSESMVPVLEKNDFIVYKSTAIEELRPEDIVVYKRPVADGHILIVHRLIAITDGYAITKGDNNSIQDEPFDADNIVGRVFLTIPQLGVAMESLSSLSGIIAVIMLFCLLILTQIIYRKIAYNAWLKKLAQTKEERAAVQAFLDM